MKYTELVIGVIIFSGVLFVLLFAAGSIGADYGSSDADTYLRLANVSANYTELETQKNGTIDKIKTRLDDAEFSIVSAAVGAIDSVLQGAKLMKDSIGTTGRLVDQVQEDSQGKIHPIVPKIIKAIITVTLIMIIFIVMMKVKPET
ncbi:hypothetical protein HYT26_00770 [Candidatus Pacearchaeota archaeon]|nr:hypothetical protein [Candidatus Pacearchaeota archaeon]